MKKYKHLIFLAIPVVVLVAWAAYHEVSSRIGEEVIVEIEGYDPRDLLSGHYLTYSVKYEKFNQRSCYENRTASSSDFLCLETGEVNGEAGCALQIKGKCSYWGGRFEAGIERFYIPQEHAGELDRLLRFGEHKATIKILVTKSGKAYVKELYFDGKPWQQFLAENNKPGAEDDVPAQAPAYDDDVNVDEDEDESQVDDQVDLIELQRQKKQEQRQEIFDDVGNQAQEPAEEYHD